MEQFVTPDQPISMTPPVMEGKKATLRKLSSSDRQTLRRRSGKFWKKNYFVLRLRFTPSWLKLFTNSEADSAFEGRGWDKTQS